MGCLETKRWLRTWTSFQAIVSGRWRSRVLIDGIRFINTIIFYQWKHLKAVNKSQQVLMSCFSVLFLYHQHWFSGPEISRWCTSKDWIVSNLRMLIIERLVFNRFINTIIFLSMKTSEVSKKASRCWCLVFLFCFRTISIDSVVRKFQMV